MQTTSWPLTQWAGPRLSFHVSSRWATQNSVKEASPIPEGQQLCLMLPGHDRATYMVSVLGQQQYPKAFHAWASIQNVNCFIKIILVLQQDGKLWYTAQKKEIIKRSLVCRSKIKNKIKFWGKQSHWRLWDLKRPHRDIFFFFSLCVQFNNF